MAAREAGARAARHFEVEDRQVRIGIELSSVAKASSAGGRGRLAALDHGIGEEKSTNSRPTSWQRDLPGISCPYPAVIGSSAPWSRRGRGSAAASPVKIRLIEVDIRGTEDASIPSSA